MRRQDRPSALPLLEAGLYCVPDKPLALRIHPGAGLVEQDNLGSTEHAHGVAQLSLCTSAAVLGILVCMLLYPKSHQVAVDEAGNPFAGHPANGCI